MPSNAIPIPALPPADANLIPLKDAIKAGWVQSFSGRRLDAGQLQRWATRGCRLVADGPHYLFPSIRGSRERLTCRSWAERWASFVALTVQADAARQLATRDLAKVDRRAKAAMDRFQAVNGTRS